MFRNRGVTSLRCRRSKRHPMQEYDQLPPELRLWVAQAILPWGAKSVQAAYDKALRRTGGDTRRALLELDRVQGALVAKDAAQVWGKSHPATLSGTA